MRHAQVAWYRSTLLTALGVASLSACGGSTKNGSNEAASSSAGTGGEPSTPSLETGGASTGGSTPQQETGGVTSTGGSPTSETGGSRSALPNVDAGTALGSGGFVKTPQGFLHRATVSACDVNVAIDPKAGPDVKVGGDGGADPADVSCRTNGDCTDGKFGRCNAYTFANFATAEIPQTYVRCSYGCESDADCGAGNICLCGPDVGTCISAACTHDADCGAGELCLDDIQVDPCGGGVSQSFACSAVGAECATGADCGTFSEFCDNGNCMSSAVCGRPFLVDGEPRLACAATRADYAAAMTPNRRGLSNDARAALAAHYVEVGLMEHASVAAFARFSLELLALGAPSELVRAAQSAMGDELTHARLAFGLATAYGGAPVGPGPLAIERALADSDFVSVVRTAFLEACIGETCAAAEVAEARDAATDPVVRAALTQIAEDELRHATLGYRFVQWALESASPETARELRRMMARELAALASTPLRLDGATTHSSALAAHGFISERARADARRQALTDIVRPCVAALLGDHTELVRLSA